MTFKQLYYNARHSFADFAGSAQSRIREIANTNRTSKVKIVAVAKNEAAYLPEWIFHHLYFGFDMIEVHINRCSDNSKALVNYFSNYPKVNIVDADEFFESCKINPQVDTYRKALPIAYKQGFTHVLFIDIDEFWTPLDLKTSIHEFIESIGPFHSVPFKWINKIREESLFSRAIEPKLYFEHAPQVKSLISSAVIPYKLNPHNVVNNRLLYKQSDGRPFLAGNEAFSRFRDEHSQSLLPVFILHRYYRSEIEYVATLGKGRPKFREEGVTTIKSNRKGYTDNLSDTCVEFPQKNYMQYHQYLNTAMGEYKTSGLLNVSRKHVLEIANHVLNLICSLPKSEAPKIKKVIKNLKSEEITNAYRKFCDNNKENETTL